MQGVGFRAQGLLQPILDLGFIGFKDCAIIFRTLKVAHKRSYET